MNKSEAPRNKSEVPRNKSEAPRNKSEVPRNKLDDIQIYFDSITRFHVKIYQLVIEFCEGTAYIPVDENSTIQGTAKDIQSILKKYYNIPIKQLERQLRKLKRLHTDG